MTHEQANALPAGLELDAAACRGLGIEPKRDIVSIEHGEGFGTDKIVFGDAYPPISTDVAAAFAGLMRYHESRPDYAREYIITQAANDAISVEVLTDKHFVVGFGETLPLAIARAAAQIVGAA